MGSEQHWLGLAASLFSRPAGLALFLLPLTGLLQAIIFLEQEETEEAVGRESVICSDSKYAIGCAEGTLNGEKNLAMYLLVRERFESEKKRRNGQVELIHVKGHSGDVGNDHADCLAWWGKRPGPPSQLRVASGVETEEDVEARDGSD